MSCVKRRIRLMVRKDRIGTTNLHGPSSRTHEQAPEKKLGTQKKNRQGKENCTMRKKSTPISRSVLMPGQVCRSYPRELTKKQINVKQIQKIRIKSSKEETKEQKLCIACDTAEVYCLVSMINEKSHQPAKMRAVSRGQDCNTSWSQLPLAPMKYGHRQLLMSHQFWLDQLRHVRMT